MQARPLQKSSILTAILLATSTAIPLIIAYMYPVALGDDAYITLTYAKNIAHGNGFVFNHSPPTLGTTTPLFTLIVARLAIVFNQISVPVIAVFVSAMSVVGMVWTLYIFRTVWGLVNWQAGILALVLAMTTALGSFGMEAALFSFLLVLSLSLFQNGRYWLTGLITGLLFLTRGEGVLILAILFLYLLVQHWYEHQSIGNQFLQDLFSLALGFALPVLCWAIYAQLTFGSFIPNTLAAKQAQGENGLGRTFLSRLLNEWIPRWKNVYSLKVLSYSISLWWTFIIAGLVGALFRKRQWLTFVGWIFLYILGYTLLNVSAYPWYRIPIAFVCNVFFGLGLVTVAEMLHRQLKFYVLSRAISTIIIGSMIFVQAQSVFNYMHSYQGDWRAASYMELGRWFRENSNPSESIAYLEIGYLGYYTENRIIDLAGLVLPDLVPNVAQADFTSGFWQYEPDYYVYLPDFDWALADVREDSRFEQFYVPVAELPGPRKTDFVIYKRSD